MKARNILATMALASVALTSCNVKTRIDEIKQHAKEELKASHEYRDSEKWGKVTEKDIQTEAFNSIQVNGAVDVNFIQSDTLGIRVLGNEKAIDEYQFFTNEDQLVIGLKDYKWESSNHHIDKDTPAITAYVMAPSLSDITIYGAGDIVLDEGLQQSSPLTINVNGAGDIEGKRFAVSSLTVNINGAGDVKIKKVTCQGNAEVTVNGAGDVDAKMKCANAIVIVNGAGDIKLNAECNELTAECNGAGDITLRGECNILNKKDGATGAIDSRNLRIHNKTNIR